MSGRRITIATCQFAESWKPLRNAATIERYIAQAARQGADIVQFHEGALSGYCGRLGESDYPWPELREATQSVMSAAAAAGVWVALGSAHPLTPPHRPHNSLYLISPDGRLADRYDKRFCMQHELEFYSPGDHFVTFDLKGVRCGLLICFDLRFPSLYRQLARKGVQAVLQSFNTGRFEGPGIHSHVMRQTLQGHAGTYGLFIAAANSSARHSRWPGVFITPDGKIESHLSLDRAGMMLNVVDTAQPYYAPVAPFRRQLLAGSLGNGPALRDRRSRSRRSL